MEQQLPPTEDLIILLLVKASMFVWLVGFYQLRQIPLSYV